ncbi:hypothetical protein NQZ71_10225 [Niallia taxi]|uniref:hypothetical protein n=1 Tax=Niallia taxi TaxID=2499688 RepID=UPI0011A7B26E|nr:hypothetical protein [Niallia taxi]MDE5053443.1 hypothetical protein [Niallia taxi]WOD61213.1 hypothetical protein NQZ71_10225 [Niallia taxi]
MKKLLILLVGGIIFANGHYTYAKTETKAERVEGYFTTEDILFSIFEPKLIKIVQDQYGKEMIVNPLKVEDVAIMQKQTGKNSYNGWYEVKLSILVGEPDGDTYTDTVILEIDAPNIGGTAPRLKSEKVNGLEIKLVKYYKGS